MNQEYSGKIRVRSCGLLFEDGKILLIEIRSPVTKKLVWMPPGGGVEFGESLEKALTREFHEETGLDISVGKLVHVNELIESQFHAIEFYYLVNKTGGNLKLGNDPEHSAQDQILHNIQFFSEEEINEINAAPDFLKKDVWTQKWKHL